MNRRSLSIFAALIVLAAAAAASDLPSAWRTWRYSRSILAVPPDMHEPVNLRLPWDLFAHSDAHATDFRIIDEAGREIPFSLFSSQTSEPQPQVRPSQIIERSFVPGQFTQVVIRVTDRPPLDQSHGATLDQLQAEPWFNTYRISTSESDFMYWVETAVSDDAHEWRVLDARSPISRFRKHQLEGNQTVQFEGYSNQRFLRVRILSPERQIPIDSVEVLSQDSKSTPERLSIPASFASESSADSSESHWLTDLGTGNLPVSEISFSTAQPEFYRAVRISTSEDKKDWHYRCAGEIYRFREGDKLKESLRILVPETFARFWRVEIVNANDQPLTDTHMQFTGLPRQLVFPVQPGHSYRLLYGNLKAAQTQYDFGRVFGHTEKKVLLLAQLGAEELTANYADPRPFTERHPNLLWVALGLAIALLVYAALRALRTSEPAA
jgi:Protein of unknown function (DUF3999)